MCGSLPGLGMNRTSAVFYSGGRVPLFQQVFMYAVRAVTEEGSRFASALLVISSRPGVVLHLSFAIAASTSHSCMSLSKSGFGLPV